MFSKNLIALASLLLTFSTLVACGGKEQTPGSRGSGAADEPAATNSSAGSISGGLEDWLDTLCAPGKYMDGTKIRGSTGGGTCISASNGAGGPIFVTQWDSNFKMRNAMDMMHMCYTSVIEGNGDITTFSIILSATSKRVFEPLAQFGFYPTC